MRILHSPQEMMEWRNDKNRTQTSIGFVPTMGALHAGHGELLSLSRQQNEISILSIFINPVQFNDKNDFEKYPVTWDRDLALAKSMGVDVIWAPQSDQMYPDNYRFRIIENDFSKRLCGKDRPGHFDGVLSVVLKLFNVVRPLRAYFGEKDFQQLALIRAMVESFFLPIEIVAVPTIRESDGLAMSSRNTRLSTAERSLAPLIYKTIKEAPSPLVATQILESHGFGVDYIEDFIGRRFVAAKLGKVRLIDNIQI